VISSTHPYGDPVEQHPGNQVADTAGDVAARVRQVIAEAGCSQREFARRIVMDPSKLSRSLGGSRRFTVAELARIADAGSVDAAWLLGSGRGTGRVSGVMAAANARTTAAPSAAAPTAPITPAGGRPLQIVRETVRLIAERGFHAVRVSDIAEACSTSTAAIHYHFPGRAELLEAAVRWCMDEDTAHRAARIAEADDAADELRQLIELQTPRTAQQRRQWLVWLDLWAEAARSTAIGRLHADYYRQWRTTVADVIRRGIAQGVFRSTDPEFGALQLTALIDGLAAQVLATAPTGRSAAATAPSNDGSHGIDADDMRAALLAHVEAQLAAPARRQGHATSH
jgi:AcrR family transcriptional regulator